MRLWFRLSSLFVICLSFGFISCASSPTFSYQNVTLTLTPYPICNGCTGGTGTGSFYYQQNPAGAGGITGAYEMPRGGGTGGCIEIKANVTNAPVNPTWTVLPFSGTSAYGTVKSSSGGTNFFCETSSGSAPIFTGAALAQAQQLGLPQGTVELQVTNPADPNDPSKVVSAQLYFTYELLTPPTGVSVGFNGLTAGGIVNVPLGGTYQFNGYVAGINGFDPCTGGNGAGSPTGIPAYAVTYMVNNVVGGAGTGTGQFGTISPTGLYTAPGNYPSATVKSATVAVQSTACPTIITSPGITVNFE